MTLNKAPDRKNPIGVRSGERGDHENWSSSRHPSTWELEMQTISRVSMDEMGAV
jgi:hypothetical protein